MSRNSSAAKAIRMLDAHNKALENATSQRAMERISRKTFTIMRETVNARVDAKARGNPEMFHHVYEWDQAGNATARLFKVVSQNRGSANFSLSYEFLPSGTPNRNGQVFPNKAFVMESGMPVEIAPVTGDYLAFEIDGEEVVTRGPVLVESPGGEQTKGAFYNEFMYLTRPSTIQKNPVFQQMLQDEMKQAGKDVMRG